MSRKTWNLVLLACMVMLAGCNTIAGIDRTIQKVGGKVEQKGASCKGCQVLSRACHPGLHGRRAGLARFVTGLPAARRIGDERSGTRGALRACGAHGRGSTPIRSQGIGIVVAQLADLLRAAAGARTNSVWPTGAHSRWPWPVPRRCGAASAIADWKWRCRRPAPRLSVPPVRARAAGGDGRRHRRIRRTRLALAEHRDADHADVVRPPGARGVAVRQVGEQNWATSSSDFAPTGNFHGSFGSGVPGARACGLAGHGIDAIHRQHHQHALAGGIGQPHTE